MPRLQSRSLTLYFRTGRSSSCNVPFASLVFKTKTNIYKEIVNKRKKNELATEMLRQTRQGKSSKSLFFNLYVVLQPATRNSRSQMFFKIGVLRSFVNFIGKHLYQCLRSVSVY